MGLEKNTNYSISFHGNRSVAMATKMGFWGQKPSYNLHIRQVGDWPRKKIHKISVSMVTDLLPWQPKRGFGGKNLLTTYIQGGRGWAQKKVHKISLSMVTKKGFGGKKRVVFTEYHGNSLVSMETNALSSFSHSPSNFPPRRSNMSNSNYSKIQCCSGMCEQPLVRAAPNIESGAPREGQLPTQSQQPVVRGSSQYRVSSPS